MERGTVSMLGPDRNAINNAYYMTIWEKVEGEWKIYRDVISGMPVPLPSGN